MPSEENKKRLEAFLQLATEQAQATRDAALPVAKKSFRRMKTWNWKLILFNAAVLPCIFILYWMINAQGLRQITILATPLYKVPLPIIGQLKHYDGLYRLDLANILAILQLCFVWVFWIVIVKYLFYGPQVSEDGLNQKSYYAFILTIAVLLIVGDTIVFYAGTSDHLGSMWAGDNPVFVPAVASITYMALLAAIAFFHVRLSRSESNSTQVPMEEQS